MDRFQPNLAESIFQYKFAEMKERIRNKGRR